MSKLAVRVERLSKLYKIGLHNSHNTLRDQIAYGVRTLLRQTDQRPVPDGEQSVFWALKDISFELGHGEVLGIIGRNGAGKSTLLKILSRITEPTTGTADIYGRVGSLLEVGTGFHAELTGRENVYLNGAILGMGRSEISRKFDEIVAFAEVEKFIDTPVKRYSSGMHLRLAFAVAAHLEPEILLVDEVLAVGDVVFQSKCLGKMSEVASEGRTILFVSHNMGAIVDLCRNALWIDAGQMRLLGQAQKVVGEYLRSSTTSHPCWERPESDPPNSKATLLSARILSKNGVPTSVVEFEQPFYIEIAYRVARSVAGCTIAYRLRNGDGVTVLVSSERDTTQLETETRRVGTYRSLCQIPGSLLRYGPYFLTIGAYIEGAEIIERYENILSFEVSVVDCPAGDGRSGIIAPLLEWQYSFEGG